MYWKKLSDEEIKERVLACVNENLNFREGQLLGIPGTYLDDKVFPPGDIIKDKPFLTSFVANPNHIGVHTMGESEIYFRGTHKLEREVIRICAEEFMACEKDKYDGYVASGGTEANIQGVWQLRNYFMEEYGAKNEEIALVHSVDTHYSCYKACNLLGIESVDIEVDESTRLMKIENLRSQLSKAKEDGIKYFAVILNMGTTMFGSVDDEKVICDIFDSLDVEYRIHIDGAFGGFIYPLTNTSNKLNLSHPKVVSVTMDAHKMLQAPYGTGIFLTKKGMINYTSTNKASYVKGFDSTLCGSRSGANAISIWMILKSYGFVDGTAFCEDLIRRTNVICDELDEMGIEYYRNPFINIVALKSECFDEKIAKKYHLVGETTENPKWYKVVVMDHVKDSLVNSFLKDLRASR